MNKIQINEKYRYKWDLLQPSILFDLYTYLYLKAKIFFVNKFTDHRRPLKKQKKQELQEVLKFPIDIFCNLEARNFK